MARSAALREVVEPLVGGVGVSGSVHLKEHAGWVGVQYVVNFHWGIATTVTSSYVIHPQFVLVLYSTLSTRA